MLRILNWNKTEAACVIPTLPFINLEKTNGLELFIHQWWEIANLRVKKVQVMGDSTKLFFHQPESNIQNEHPWPAPWISKETGNSAFYLTNAIQFLDRQGIISLSQEFSEKINIQFIIPSKEVIRYISLNHKDEEIILAILRAYPGIYDTSININLTFIANKSKHNEAEIQTVLEKLKDNGIIDYHSKNNDTTLIFNEIREDERTINRIAKYLENQNKLKKEHLNNY